MSSNGGGGYPPLRMSDASLVESLASGKAFVDLSSWTKVGVSGADASTWLNDLVSADISALGL